MRATVDRAVPAGLLPDPHTVRHLCCHGAADRAMRADALMDGHRGAWRGRRAGLGLTHAGDRQRTQRRETAGSQTRAAQESAAIETSIRFIGEGGQRAALSLAFCPLDQHRCLLQLGYRLNSVKGLDVLGLPVARLALLIVGLAVRYGLGRKRNGSGDGRAEAECTKELTTSECRLAFHFHRRVLLWLSRPLRPARECLRLDLHEKPSDLSRLAIEVGRIRLVPNRRRSARSRGRDAFEKIAAAARPRSLTGRRPARP